MIGPIAEFEEQKESLEPGDLDGYEGAELTPDLIEQLQTCPACHGL